MSSHEITPSPEVSGRPPVPPADNNPAANEGDTNLARINNSQARSAQYGSLHFPGYDTDGYEIEQDNDYDYNPYDDSMSSDDEDHITWDHQSSGDQDSGDDQDSNLDGGYESDMSDTEVRPGLGSSAQISAYLRFFAPNRSAQGNVATSTRTIETDEKERTWIDDGKKRAFCPFPADLIRMDRRTPNPFDGIRTPAESRRDWANILVQHENSRLEREKNLPCACGLKDVDIAWKKSHQADCEAIRAAEIKMTSEEKRFSDVRESKGYTGIYLWFNIEAYEYQRARFLLATMLMKVNSPVAAEKAVDQLENLLIHGRFDKWGVRDYMPHLYLRFHDDSKCYRFLRDCDGFPQPGNYDHVTEQNWLSAVPFDADDRYGDGRLNEYDKTKKRALEVFASTNDWFKFSRPSLSQLVALAFLKLSLHHDLRAIEMAKIQSLAVRSTLRPRLSRTVRESSWNVFRADNRNAAAVSERLLGEYEALVLIIQDYNPYFWATLVAALTTGDMNAPANPRDLLSHPPSGSKAEAARVVFQCYLTWANDIDAITTIKKDTCDFPMLPTPTSQSQAIEKLPKMDVPDTSNIHKISTWDALFEFFPEEPQYDPWNIYIVRRWVGFGEQFEDDTTSFVCVTAGVCEREGEPDARSAWAVTCMNSSTGKVKAISGRLEQHGPFGDAHPATTERAELRAAVAALRMTDFVTKNARNVIVASESDYVVYGAVHQIRKWSNLEVPWTTDLGTPVPNKDLWILLASNIEMLVARGLSVRFWKIERELNLDANYAAMEALYDSEIQSFEDVIMTNWQEPRMSWQPPSNAPHVVQLSLAAHGAGRLPLSSKIAKPTSIWHNLTDGWPDCNLEIMRTLGMALYKINHEPDPTPLAYYRPLAYTIPKPPPTRIVLTHGLDHTSNKAILELLPSLIRSGSTVILGGGFFSNNLNQANLLDNFFRGLGLSWVVNRPCVETKVVWLTPKQLVREDADLISRYTTKTWMLKGVDVSSVWYSSVWYRSGDVSKGAVSVAWTKIGEGNLGFVGDIDGEKPSREVVKRMLAI